jgi:heme exporter protein D
MRDFQFDSFMAFLLMDGHGAYVWASYIITFFALLLLVVLPSLRKKGLVTAMKRQQRLEEVRPR